MKRALATPEACFQHPSDVVALAAISNDEKIAILLNWRRSLEQLQTASDENMLRAGTAASGVAEPLAAVGRALTELGHVSDRAAT